MQDLSNCRGYRVDIRVRLDHGCACSIRGVLCMAEGWIGVQGLGLRAAKTQAFKPQTPYESEHVKPYTSTPKP